MVVNALGPTWTDAPVNATTWFWRSGIEGTTLQQPLAT